MMMDQETHCSKPCANLGNKPTSFFKNEKQIFVSLSNHSISSFDLEKNTFSPINQNMHEKRINCIREKDNVLITGSTDFTVKLWDKKSSKPIQTFMKPGASFNCLDLSDQIMCAAYASKLVFWDLRKMKQTSQFNDSFNGEITSLQFDPLTPTCFMGCSVDGMINKFDLKETDEQEAFMWGTRILECPSKLQSIKDVTLVETTNHSLFLLEQEAVKKKITVNDFQEPKHILSSNLISGNNDFNIEYFRWNLEKKIVEKFLNDQVVGYIPHVQDSEIFVPLTHKKVLYINQKGNVFIQRVSSSLSQSKPHQNSKKNQQKNESNKIPNWQKIEQEKPNNSNGYILDKPTNFKSKIQKFKPF